MGMMNSMGVNVNAQLRGNGSLSYVQQQQRFSNQVQMRQQQLLPQTSLPSPQVIMAISVYQVNVLHAFIVCGPNNLLARSIAFMLYKID